MQREYAFPHNGPLEHTKAIVSPIRTFHRQNTDWTCSIACLRTMMTAFDKSIPSEEALVEEYNLQPGPHYSEELKRIGILKNYQAVYGCDNPNITFDQVLEYMEQGYAIMLECMVNYAHWMVLLGYYPLSDNDGKTSLIFYDPYYNWIRKFRADEFMNMWQDGDWGSTNIIKDFIAIRK